MTTFDELSTPNCPGCLHPMEAVVVAWWCEQCQITLDPTAELSTAEEQNRCVPHLLEPSKWARRRRIVLEVRESTRLSGGQSSPEVHEIQDRWVDGEISREQMGEMVRSLDYGSAWCLRRD